MNWDRKVWREGAHEGVEKDENSQHPVKMNDIFRISQVSIISTVNKQIIEKPQGREEPIFFQHLPLKSVTALFNVLSYGKLSRLLGNRSCHQQNRNKNHK